jgi:ribosome-associated protein
VALARQAIEDKKAANIAVYNVSKISEITDYYLVASGMSPPHLKALASEVQHVLKEKGLYCYRRAGDTDSGWMVLDYVDVVVHVFMPEMRQYYALEELWGKGMAEVVAEAQEKPKARKKAAGGSKAKGKGRGAKAKE